MFFRRVLLFVICVCPISQLDAAPPWKRAYRAQRDVMRAQLELQQAVAGPSKQMYQQQKQSQRQQEKYLRQDYRAGGPVAPYAYPGRGPVNVIAVPAGMRAPAVPRAVYMTPSSGPTRSNASYQRVPPHAVPAQVRVPTNTYSTNRAPVAPTARRVAPTSQVNRSYSTTSTRASTGRTSNGNVVRSNPSSNGQVVSSNVYSNRAPRVYSQPTIVRQTSPAVNYTTITNSVPNPARIVETPARNQVPAGSVVYSTPQSFQAQPPVVYESVNDSAFPVVNQVVQPAYSGTVERTVQPPSVVAQPTPAKRAAVTTTSSTQQVEQLPELIPVPVAEPQAIQPRSTSNSSMNSDPQPTPAKRPADKE